MSSMRQRSRKKASNGEGNDSDEQGYTDPLFLSPEDNDDDDDDDDVSRRSSAAASFSFSSSSWKKSPVLACIVATLLVGFVLLAKDSFLGLSPVGSALRRHRHYYNKHHVQPDNGRGGVFLNTTTTTSSSDRDGMFWTLQACPSHVHGTSCPDSQEFPLSIEIYKLHDDDDDNNNQVQYMVPPVAWQPIDAHTVCGGGKAWRIPIPSTTLPGTYRIHLSWYATACLHGHEILPWNDVLHVIVNADTAQNAASVWQSTTAMSLYQPWKKHHGNLFVPNAAWHVNAIRTTNKEPPFVWSTTTMTQALGATTSTGTKRLTTQNASISENAVVVQPNPGYGQVKSNRGHDLV